MRYTGRVKIDRFAEVFGLVSQYNAFWSSEIIEKDGLIEFEVTVHDREQEFKNKLDELSVQDKPSFWQRVLFFFN